MKFDKKKTVLGVTPRGVPFKTKFKVLVSEACGWKISKIWNIIGFYDLGYPNKPHEGKILVDKTVFENRLMVLSLK